ncbi:MAG: metallophosphoesterase family protein, partial [Bryobacteraceae bacterium]
MFRFVHAADLHLDTPFVGIGRVAPGVAQRLRDASLEAFDNLIGLAIDREAAFLLLAGDLYDGPERGIRAQLRFLRGVERLGERGITVFVVHGNHDPLDGWSAIRTPPPNLVIFGSQVEHRTVERDGRRLATVYGISYPRGDVTGNLSLRFQRQSWDGLHIGLLHCTLGAQPDHAPYSPCSRVDLERAGMDYWALGHVHRRQALEGRPWIVYPGNLQSRGARAGERGAKGAVVVTAEPAAIAQVDFVALDCVRHAEVEIDITELNGLDALQKETIEAVVAEVANQQNRDLLVQVTLCGRGSLHDDLSREGVPAGLLQDLRERLEESQPMIWVDCILDQTLGALDLDAIARRGDFSSELMRTSAALGADRTAMESLMA